MKTDETVWKEMGSCRLLSSAEFHIDLLQDRNEIASFRRAQIDENEIRQNKETEIFIAIELDEHEEDQIDSQVPPEIFTRERSALPN
jgi:hypothetical protein